MRLFIVSQTESFLTKRGQRHPDLAKYVASNSVEVVYVSSNFYHAEKRYFSAEEKSNLISHGNIKHLFISIPGYYNNLGLKRICSNFLFGIKAFREVYTVIKKEDVVLVASRPIEQVFFFSLIKVFKGSRLVLDVRDIWPDALNVGNQFVQRLFRIYCNLFLSKSVRKYDEIFHTCPSFMGWIDRYTRKKHSNLIPLGYNESRFQNQFLTESRTYTSGRTRMVMIGLFQKQLNVIPLINAMDNFPNMTLHLYGDDGSGERFSMVATAVKNAKNKNIKICGSVRSELVPQVLKSYDIGVIPMDAEHALPNKFFDYVALSLPIYALGNNDATRLVEKNSLGWVSTFTVSDICATLKSISEDPRKYNKSASNIYKIRNLYGRNYLFKKMSKILFGDAK